MTGSIIRWVAGCSIYGLMGIYCLSLAIGSASAANPQPASPQPDGSALEDGLAVQYYSGVFNDMSELEDVMELEPGEDGPAIPSLDYAVGVGNVLTSGSNDFVGAHIRGLIELADPGTYQFQVTSNDGVRVTLGGVVIHEDPTVHPDTTSPPIPVEIERPGWYPLDILYFEKKRTSTLKLHWQPPGASGFAAVPAAVLKHQ